MNTLRREGVPPTSATPLKTGQSSASESIEEVRFTDFRPDHVAVEHWYSLMVYAHTLAAFDQVRADVGSFKQRMGDTVKAVLTKTGIPLPRGTEIRIVPTCAGVIFNPAFIIFKWLEDWHRFEFRFQADKALSGSEDVILVDFYTGFAPISQIKLAMCFEAEVIPTTSSITEASASVYRADKIFISYSQNDSAIVQTCLDAYKRLGLTTFIDVETLRSGVNWQVDLTTLIDQADIFQLFWSQNAAQSKWVRREWEYALKKSKTTPGFIRPTYWEKPLAPIPGELAHLHFAYFPAGLAAPHQPKQGNRLFAHAFALDYSYAHIMQVFAQKLRTTFST